MALLADVIRYLRIPRWGLLLVWGGLALPLSGQVHRMERSAPGLDESGAHRFVIINKEFMGLGSPPTDLQLMPDGRLLAVAGQQIALGDGAHWEVFNQSDRQTPSRTLEVAVDEHGAIYQSVEGGFARVDFGEDGRWFLTKLADWPHGVSSDRPLPRRMIKTNRNWYWHSDSGGILAWQPGTMAHVHGNSDTVACIFELREHTYLGDWNHGLISLLTGPKPSAEPSPGNITVLKNVFATCALPWSESEVLIGTNTAGLQLFDGSALRPFPLQDFQRDNLRINSVCQIDADHFAVALENVGVVRFDREGHTQLILDSHSDHRLNRVQKLIPGTNGLIWGLLNDGLLQFQYPTRVTFFEPIISSAIATAHPIRLDGKLWLLADNHFLRAIYQEDGRLKEFVSDTPANVFLFSASLAMGIPFGGSDDGAYVRNPDGWVRFAPESRSPAVLQNNPIKGWWPYYAENEIGWIRPGHPLPEMRRYPRPGRGKIHNTMSDGHGNIFLEFGSGLIGRYTPTDPDSVPPEIRFFDDAAGVPNGWVQVFVLDGEARLNVSDKILRFDPSGTRLEPDEDFSRNFAGLGTIIGRPGRDARGRLWLTTDQGAHIFTGELGHLQKQHEPMPAGFQPYMFTFESGGVVWLHSTRRLARYDPDIALPAPVPQRALITHVTLPSSGRVAYPRQGTINDLPYADNSLIAHFLTIGKDLDETVSFQTRLAGSGQDWVSAGTTGSAVFNALAEGEYLLQVRPVGRYGPGEISQLTFLIHPPWYRTIPAYGLGFLLLVFLVWGSAWLLTYLQRLEKKRLETIVQTRTNELKTSNEQLALQMEEIRTLSQAIQQSPVGVIIIKTDGVIAFVNPRACALSGYRADELVGQPVQRLHEPEEKNPAQTDEFARARDQGEPWQGQLTHRAKAGQIAQVRVTASPLRNNQGEIHHYLLLEEDVTATLAEQESRRRLEAQLFMAQKRESLGTLAGGIAHDFNNILTGILGYNELIKFTLGEPSAVSQELAAIRAAGQRAKELVGQILTFSRQGNTQLVPLELSRPVAEALKLIRASTPSTIEIVQNLQAGTARADSTQIHQVMLNLCTNAAYAMRHQPGRLEVSLTTVEVDATLAGEIAGLQPGPYLRLSVSDTGDGMDQPTLDRIFDPFFTTKGPGEGTGLGLSIVQGIVASHKGGLLVRSRPGQGTTFEIYFPVCYEPGTLATPADAAPRGEQQEIIVVDDEPMVTSFVAKRLAQLGYQPTVHNDPVAALANLTRTPHQFSALITDLTMPHMTGVELIRRLHEQQIDLPTLIITGYNLNADRADLASLPDCQVLNKPFTGDELAAALHKVIKSAG